MADKPLQRKGTYYVNWNVLATDLEILELISSGTTSEVYKGRLTDSSGKVEDVAVKRLCMYKDEEEAKQQLDEMKVLKQLEHENIIQFKGVVFKTDTEPYRMVTELASKGSLYDYLKAYREKDSPRLPGNLFDDWCMGGARAIQYLQRHEVAHMDIKSMNFLITENDVIKLCDFGIARKLQATIGTARERGTIRWMAPEVFKKHLVSFASDIYSFGIVIWELLTCDEPFKGIIGYAVMWAVGEQDKRPDIPDDCPEYIRELLVLCWKADHRLRPSIHNMIACLEQKDENALQNYYSSLPSPPDSSYYTTMRPSVTPFSSVTPSISSKEEYVNKNEVPSSNLNKDFNDDQEDSGLSAYWTRVGVHNPFCDRRRSSSLPSFIYEDININKNQQSTVVNAATVSQRHEPEKAQTQHPVIKKGGRYKTTRLYKALCGDEIDIEEGSVVELIDTDAYNDLWHVRLQGSSAPNATRWIKPHGLKKIRDPITLFRRRRSRSLNFEPESDTSDPGYSDMNAGRSN